MPTQINGVPAGDNASIAGNNLTVSNLRDNPAVLRRRAEDAVNEHYWADRFLPNIGSTSGGVITGELWSPELAQTDRKSEALAPGAEVPLAGTSAGGPIIASAEFSGLGYEITDEMVTRNQLWILERKEIAHANRLADDMNSAALGVLDAAVTKHSRTFLVPTPWDEIVVDGAAPTPSDEWPHFTLSVVRASNFAGKVPFKYTALIAHSDDLVQLARIYPGDGIKVDAISHSDTLGLDLIPDTTGKAVRGAPYLAAAGGIGGTAWEQPLKTEVIPQRTRRRTIVQSTASPAYIVDNPWGALKLLEVYKP